MDILYEIPMRLPSGTLTGTPRVMFDGFTRRLPLDFLAVVLVELLQTFLMKFSEGTSWRNTQRNFFSIFQRVSLEIIQKSFQM